MNDASFQTNSILATALRILLEQTSADSEASAEWSGALVSALSPFFPSEPASSVDLIGAPAAQPGLQWHADQLVALCQERVEVESAADRARRNYHARMLGYGLTPERKEFRPLVTVLLPVFNRSGPLIEAVQSCVDQTWRPIEILVIDDGSTDDPETALAPFGAAVGIIHKPNGGVASARNLGLRMAQGDFIQLLDSDDLLCPTAIESKVAAFASVCDAELCYGQSQWIDMRCSPPQMKALHLRELHNPIRSLIVEFAFPVPTVMMPRWRMLAMPPFEEDLFRSSDFRCWQRLGFDGIKVVGVRGLTAYLRRFKHSLQTTPHPHDDSHALALLRSLRELFRHTHAWPYAVEYTNIMFGERTRKWFERMPSERLRPVLADLLNALRRSAEWTDQGRLSMLPMLVALQGRINQHRRHGHWVSEDPASVYGSLSAAISAAVDGAAPLSERDIAFWSRKPDAPLRYQGLHAFFETIAKADGARKAAPLADALLRRARKVPSRRFVRLAGRLQPVLGARLAGTAAARWLQWSNGG